MTQQSQGDIFEAATKVQLAVVFGYIGFNEMHLCWMTFKKNLPQLLQVRNPFTELSGQAVEWSPGKRLWFVPAKDNHGMTTVQLTNAFDEIFTWALQNRITSVATNGIANTDHGTDTAANRRSDQDRAIWLKDYANKAEQKYKIAIELISLNDIFVY
ncbi:hypothetical protein [Rheinheimera sp.]|uniref:hypothetical protein n=1 Tax=Rheinheimera sp. TaxID=1869214 RepID=UPI0040470790